jgi:hypothetical protein
VGPDDLKGIHRYEVKLAPSTPSNEIIETRAIGEKMQLKLITYEDAVERAGANPDEVEKSWLLHDLKGSQEVQNALKQRILQKIATIESAQMAYYRSKLFNPDGSPNPAGRDEQLRRLGSDGFATVFKAVTQHWPELKPAEQEEISVPDEWPTVPNGGLPAPVLPSGPGGQPPPGPGPMMR